MKPNPFNLFLKAADVAPMPWIIRPPVHVMLQYRVFNMIENALAGWPIVPDEELPKLSLEWLQRYRDTVNANKSLFR